MHCLLRVVSLNRRPRSRKSETNLERVELTALTGARTLSTIDKSIETALNDDKEQLVWGSGFINKMVLDKVQ